LKYIQETEEKWKRTDTQLDEINVNFEALTRKTKQHDTERMELSGNVFDYSYKEMASSFEFSTKQGNLILTQKTFKSQLMKYLNEKNL